MQGEQRLRIRGNAGTAPSSAPVVTQVAMQVLTAGTRPVTTEHTEAWQKGDLCVAVPAADQS